MSQENETDFIENFGDDLETDSSDDDEVDVEGFGLSQLSLDFFLKF